MGIKTSLSNLQLPEPYRNYTLKPTQDGVRDTVYLLGDDYVLKHFSNISKESIKNEQKLLAKLESLKVPKMLEYFEIDGKNCVVFSQISGESPKEPTLKQIENIGKFLKEFHRKTEGMKNSNIKLFEKSRLKTLVDETEDKVLLEHFKNINIELNNNGIIHGDLFTDNAKFVGDELSGVYDFTEACEGDFLFDLAVVAVAWCYNNCKVDDKKLNTLLVSYETAIDKTEFKAYMRYALLYYATTRYLAKRDYKELLKKLENI